MQLGSGAETALNQFPSDIIVDRCIAKGDDTSNTRRAIALEVVRGAVIDSYLYDIKDAGSDAQAILTYNSPGPLKIVNNYLEATGENMMTGGADPSYANAVPSDIEIRRNYFKKQSSATWAASWSVKNILEFKNAQRVLVEGNVLETCYPDSQTGFALLFTVRNQDGTAPWSVVQDITFRYNKVLDTDSFTQVLGTDDTNTSEDTARLDIRHNLIRCTNSSATVLRMLQISSPAASVKLVHNTMLFADGAGNSFGQSGGTPAMTGFVFRDNIVSNGLYGFRSDTEAAGTATLDAFYTGYDFTYNVRIGSGGTYPATNQTAADYAAVGFTDSGAGDFSLSVGSSFKGDASDATDPGADWSTLTTKTANSITGAWGSEHSTYTTESTVNAELPRSYIDTSFVSLPTSGTTWTVTLTTGASTAGTGTRNATDCSLAYALANCTDGDVISVDYTKTITGSFTLRAR
jgi:hypothetical protein